MNEYDIRNYMPEINDEIEIIGDLANIFEKEELDYLNKTMHIEEISYDGGVMHIKLIDLFTINDVKQKVKEMMEEDKK